MLSTSQRDQIVSIINDAADLTIATVRADGWPQATTVSYVNDGLTLYFGTWVKSQKTTNLTRDPRVSLTINLPYQTWDQIRGLSMSGKAHRVREPAELERIFQLMIGKFPQTGQFLKGSADVEMALFRIDIEHISVLDYTQGFGHTEEVTA